MEEGKKLSKTSSPLSQLKPTSSSGALRELTPNERMALDFLLKCADTDNTVKQQKKEELVTAQITDIPEVQITEVVIKGNKLPDIKVITVSSEEKLDVVSQLVHVLMMDRILY